MKRTACVMIGLLLAFILSPCFCAVADAGAAAPASEASFIFPASLITIEDRAFENTAVKTVVFPQGFRTLGRNAFAGSGELTDAYIPATVRYIAKSAFSGNTKLTVHGVRGSYAEKWAARRHTSFVEDNIWNGIKTEQYPGIKGALNERYTGAAIPTQNNRMFREGENEGRSRRPQDRPELNPIDYRFP